MLDPISGRIRFLGASLWTYPQFSCVTLCSSAAVSNWTTMPSVGHWSHSSRAFRRLFPPTAALHLTIVDTGHPVSLTAFLPLHDGDSINTSLRVGFAALGPGFDGESRVVFYAATPGAFVDLAADFGYALDTPIAMAGIPAGSTGSTDGAGRHCLDQCDGDRTARPWPAVMGIG